MSQPRGEERLHYDVEQAEDYELPDLAHPSTSDSSPLLPTYDSHLPQLPSPLKTPATHYSPDGTHGRARLRRRLSCACLGILLALLALALATCAFGERGLRKVQQWDQWDKVPSDWQEWLEGLVPGKVKPDPASFPTNIGYAGPTPTGKEAALLATAPAQPIHTAVAPLLPPQQKTTSGFSIMQHWGNLSPYYSVDSHGLPETDGLVPDHCELRSLHWLQRHGARYPTTDENGVSGLVGRLKAAKATGKFKSSGDLAFLNHWEYKLGSEVLTPFGRSQLYNLGVAARVKYGYLLDKMDGRLPVFRTESQDRMLKSAQNFAAGFFGIPVEDQYNLEVMIEAPGFNCTLAPWQVCKAENHTGNTQLPSKLAQWDSVFLADAHSRLSEQISGYDLTFRDTALMMEMCAYETVALGYSKFCDLFSQKEWKGYEYRMDITWWYYASFGFPLAKAQGIGWVQELVSRLTHTRLTQFNSTTNSSFHDDVHFPLNDPINIDFTHDTVFALLLPTMNLTTFAESGVPPLDKIPKNRSFISSKIVPFATNMQIQVLSCGNTDEEEQVRMILNDAAVPLTGLNGCPDDEQGLCPLATFVSALQTLIGEIDFAQECGVVGTSE